MLEDLVKEVKEATILLVFLGVHLVEHVECPHVAASHAADHVAARGVRYPRRVHHLAAAAKLKVETRNKCVNNNSL